MKKQLWIGPILLAAALAGCVASNSQTSGTILGGLTGGLVGSAFGKGNGKTAAVGIGAVLGAVIGSNIGANMDQNDRDLAETAAHNAARAPIDQEIHWNNTNSGHSGLAKTIKIGTNAQGDECRKIEQQVTIDGKTDVILIDICLIDRHWVVAA